MKSLAETVLVFRALHEPAPQPDEGTAAHLWHWQHRLGHTAWNNSWPLGHERRILSGSPAHPRVPDPSHIPPSRAYEATGAQPMGLSNLQTPTEGVTIH